MFFIKQILLNFNFYPYLPYIYTILLSFCILENTEDYNIYVYVDKYHK
jgi:hypothetical protein